MFKLFALTLVMLLSTGSSFAQSQRNYGPDGPATGDTMGQRYSGGAYARSGDSLPYTDMSTNSTGAARITGIIDTGIADDNVRALAGRGLITRTWIHKSADGCPLSGVKRTSQFQRLMCVIDPKQTLRLPKPRPLPNYGS
jgi:hypothetical protein